jgi:hypothetical protein
MPYGKLCHVYSCCANFDLQTFRPSDLQTFRHQTFRLQTFRPSDLQTFRLHYLFPDPGMPDIRSLQE